MSDRARSDGERVLYQFPISHYCEKVRWHLDAKQLPYRTRNLLPGFHRWTLKRIGSPTTTVPVLREGGAATPDSLHISQLIEARHPEPALLPPPGAARTRCLELERFFSEEIGPSVRVWIFGMLLSEATGKLRRTFFREYGPAARFMGRLYGGLLPREVRRLYGIDDAAIERARAHTEVGLTALERELRGARRDYLIGDRLTLADLAAASMFGPLVLPPESPWRTDDLSGAFAGVVEITRKRPAGLWVLRRYREDRFRAIAAEIGPIAAGNWAGGGGAPSDVAVLSGR